MARWPATAAVQEEVVPTNLSEFAYRNDVTKRTITVQYIKVSIAQQRNLQLTVCYDTNSTLTTPPTITSLLSAHGRGRGLAPQQTLINDLG